MNISKRHFNPIPLSIKAPNLIKKSLRLKIDI